jgi:Domain of unknown function (DUF4440)
MRAIVFAIVFCLSSGAALAQAPSDAADHDALRKLKSDVLDAINARDLGKIDMLLHKPFMTTVITQDSFTDAGQLKSYFDDLFSRNFLRIKSITMRAEADDLAQIYRGATIAVARGTTRELYELADGRSFDIPGRWTAVAIRENGQWQLLAIHSGTNFLDNPVLGAIEKSALYFGAGGAVGGAIIGLLLGLFLRRRRA